jgi:hypothetical protein
LTFEAIGQAILPLANANVSDYSSLRGILVSFSRLPAMQLFVSAYLAFTVLRYLGAVFSAEIILEDDPSSTPPPTARLNAFRFSMGAIDFLCNVGILTMLLMAAYSLSTGYIIEFAIWACLAVLCDLLFCIIQFSLVVMSKPQSHGVRKDIVCDYRRWLFHWILIDIGECVVLTGLA